MDLTPFQALDPYLLAEHLNVKVMGSDEVPDLPADVKETLKEDSDSWSAVTINLESKNLIILNAVQSKARSSSNLTHELSHILIGHKAARVDLTEDGILILNTFDKVQEDEADWLSGSLLLPRDALVRSLKNKKSTEEIASEFQVSTAMVNFRVNVTGVRNQTR